MTYDLAPSDLPPCPLELLGTPAAEAPLRNHPNGWPPLLDALAARYGLTSDAIALSAGTTGANSVTMMALLRPGDHVVVEHPVYDPLVRIPEMLGATVGYFERRPESDYALDVEAIRRAITSRTRLIVISNLYNPAGVRASEDTLRAVAQLADEYDVHVLVDEVYLEWFYDLPQAFVHAAATLSPRVITTSSLTKAFGLGAIHIGWAVATPALAERIRRTALLAGVIAAHPSERIAERAIANGDAIVAPWRSLTAQHRALVGEWVERIPGATWSVPDAGTTAFIRLGRGDTRGIGERLVRECDTAVVPGAFFGDVEAIRIGVGVQTEILIEGLRRIKAALVA